MPSFSDSAQSPAHVQIAAAWDRPERPELVSVSLQQSCRAPYGCPPQRISCFPQPPHCPTKWVAEPKNTDFGAKGQQPPLNCVNYADKAPSPHVECTEARIDLEKALPAFSKHLIEGGRFAEIGGYVVTVNPQHGSWCQPVPEVDDSLVIEQNVNVGRKHVSAARATDADIFADHLKQRQPVCMRELRVHSRRDSYYSNSGGAKILRPFQHFFQRWTTQRRVPFDQDQFSPESMLAALRNYAVDEVLHSAKHVTAVIVVTRNRDHADLWSLIRGNIICLCQCSLSRRKSPFSRALAFLQSKIFRFWLRCTKTNFSTYLPFPGFREGPYVPEKIFANPSASLSPDVLIGN